MTTRVFSSDSSRTSLMPLEDLLVDELGDALDQLGAVDAKRNLRDDNILPSTLDLLRRHAGAHPHRAAPRLEIGPECRRFPE